MREFLLNRSAVHIVLGWFLQTVAFLPVLMVLHCQDLGDGYYIPPDPYADVETSDLQAAWSSDGEWICYRHEDYGLTDTSYPTGLYTMKADGTSRYLIVPGEAFTPDWSNDGEWIAFFSGAIHILKVGTDSISALTPFAAFFPSWSPNDNRLVFDTSYEDPQGAHAIWIIGRAGGNLTDISDHGTGEWRSADWSPEGSTIVHYRYIGVGAQEIFTMDTLGENSMRLTYNSVEDFRPRWSPEGSQIAWWLRMGLANEVWVMSEDGTNQQKLTDGTYPNWSPDSKRIVFSNVNPAGDRVVLWTINLDGSDLTQLTF